MSESADFSGALGGEWYGKSKLWQDYKKVRPKYPRELFTKLFAFHDEHGGQYKVAADFGTGIGILIPTLLQRFSSVTASDMNATLIGEIAATYADDPSVDVHVAKAEDSHEWLADGSVDLCIAGEAIHWFDLGGSVWLRNCARLLKPGGTVACMLYTGSVLILSNGEANKIWNAYSLKTLEKWPARQFIEVIGSLGLTIPFDQDCFQDEYRFRYHLPEPEAFELLAKQRGYDSGVPPASFDSQPTPVTRACNMQEFEAYLSSRGALDIATDPEWAIARQGILRACGGPQSTFTIAWNMSIAMASRR